MKPRVAPHGGGTVVAAGPSLEQAESAMILVHGRGATAASILGLTAELDAEGMACLAPQAAGHSWYPASFLAPVEVNEPGRSSGLAVLESLVQRLQDAGIASHRVILLGFSQGACLALEFAARNPRRYGGVVGLTGGLIGPPEALVGFAGSLDGTPVFLGSGDPDPHVPFSRVEQTAQIFTGLGAEVTLRRYPGRGHTVSRDELQWVRDLVSQIEATRASSNERDRGVGKHERLGPNFHKGGLHALSTRPLSPVGNLVCLLVPRVFGFFLRSSRRGSQNHGGC